jgi:uncharacterized protein YbdZ (MbtH family)
MQNPTEEAESISTDTTVYSNGTHWDRTVNVRRKAAKRTHPFDLTAEELLIVPSSSLSPQDEDIPARKKPRLEEPFPKTADEVARTTTPQLRRSTRQIGKKLPKYFASLSPPQDEDIPVRKMPRLEESHPTTRARTRSTTTDEGARMTTSPDVSVGLPPPAAGEDDDDDDDDDDTNADSVTDTQPNAGATGCWTLEEDAKLTRAMKNTCKKKHGSKYNTDWVSIAALVPGRTRGQCLSRWHNRLDPSIGRKGKWTAVEDSKLKDAVQTHGDKEWDEIAALVPGRTRSQCWSRWKDVLGSSIGRASERKGKWTAVEDSKLKDAVHTHGDKDWGTIAALVPGRTGKQCSKRWHAVLVSSIGQVSGRKGKWTAVEDSKLKDAVHAHGDKDWGTIAALVPGRTRDQCWSRWKNAFDPSIDRANQRTGKWTVVEDNKLKDAVQAHGDKDWGAITALVPGRTKSQCSSRWKKCIDPNRKTLRVTENITL